MNLTQELQFAQQFEDDPQGFVEKMDYIFEKKYDHNSTYPSIEFDKSKTQKKAIYFCSIGDYIWQFSYSKLAFYSWNTALNYYKKIDNVIGEMKCYANLGNAYDAFGEYGKAIDYQNKSLEISKQIGDELYEAHCYISLGATLYNLGEYGKAIDYQKKALEISKQIENETSEVLCYINLGVCYRNIGESGKAIEFLNNALNALKQLKNEEFEAHCYGSLGVIYKRNGEDNKAKEYLLKALKIDKKIGNIAGESYCYEDLGSICYNNGEYSKSLYYIRKAISLKKQLKDIAGESNCYLNLSKTFYSLEKYDKTYETLVEGINIVEKIGKTLFQEDLKVSLYSKYAYHQNIIIPVCYKLDKKEEMFEYLEKGKSKVLLDILSTTGIKPPEILIKNYNHLLQKEDECNIALKQAQMRHINQSGIQISIDMLDKIIKNREELYQEIENISPECKEYLSLRRGRALNLRQVQELIKSQNKKTVLVEYFISEDNGYIFVIDSDNLYVKEISATYSEIINLVDSYFKEVVEYSERGNTGNSWLELSLYLIDPISEYLKDKELIYFVPYGILHYLPFHSLEIAGESIIKNYAVCYAPSASVISHCKTKENKELKTAVSFVTPAKNDSAKFKEYFKYVYDNLPGLVNKEKYYDRQATKDNVLRNIKNKDIIHFYCHGLFDAANPLESGLNLYNDEILTAKEIFNLTLKANLITLGACQTGLNDNKSGDELIGLTRAFLYAGTSSILVSLWSVNAQATNEFMQEFYNQLKSGEDKVSALRNTQLKIMNRPEYAHPYYWAPFTLIGDWE